MLVVGIGVVASVVVWSRLGSLSSCVVPCCLEVVVAVSHWPCSTDMQTTKSNDNFVNRAKNIMVAAEMSPPDSAKAPPKPMAPAPTMQLVKLKMAPPTDDP